MLISNSILRYAESNYEAYVSNTVQGTEAEAYKYLANKDLIFRINMGMVPLFCSMMF
jgi:hypothetical protein